MTRIRSLIYWSVNVPKELQILQLSHTVNKRAHKKFPFNLVCISSLLIQTAESVDVKCEEVTAKLMAHLYAKISFDYYVNFLQTA